VSMRPPFLRVRRCLTQARLQEPCRTLSWDTNEQPRGARRSCLQTHWYRSCPKQFSPQAIARVLETAPVHAKPLLVKTDSKYAIQCSYPHTWSSMLTIVPPRSGRLAPRVGQQRLPHIQRRAGQKLCPHPLCRRSPRLPTRCRPACHFPARLRAQRQRGERCCGCTGYGGREYARGGGAGLGGAEV
jgi:hypothetical protein